MLHAHLIEMLRCNPIKAIILVAIISDSTFGNEIAASKIMTFEEYKSVINYTKFNQASNKYFQAHPTERKTTTCNAQPVKLSDGRQNAAIAEEKYRWNILYIHIDETFYGDSEAQIIEALSELIRHSCFEVKVLNTRDNTGTFDYVYIRNGKPGSGCNSDVGKQGGEQVVNLEAPDCIAKVAVIHEMMHALGYWHEHSRPDRDNFITIRTEYVVPRHLHNFDIKESSLTFNLPYDQNSILHYQSTAFSIDDVHDTIIAKDGRSVGDDGDLTSTDIEKIRIISGCAGSKPIEWIDGPDGAKWSNDCNFPGNEFSFKSTSMEACGRLCSRNQDCDKFNWRPLDDGTCSLKEGKGDLNPTRGGNPEGICGFVDKSWKIGMRGMVWADGCEFPDPNVKIIINVSKDTCEEECLSREDCVKYSWNSRIGGTCNLKKDAGSTKPKYGVNPNGTCGMKWKWNGSLVKWDEDCGFRGNDIGFYINVRKEECGTVCYLDCQCVRFMWSSANNGTCSLKKGNRDTTLTVGSNKNGLCGYLDYSTEGALKYGFCGAILNGFDTAPGGQFDLQVISRSNPRQCCGYCKKLGNCKAFVFNFKTRDCYLKEHNHPKVYVGGNIISGNPSCTGRLEGSDCHGHTKGVEVAPGIEFTISTDLADSVKDCCVKCTLERDCKAFVYSQVERNCTLKNDNTPWVKIEDSVDIVSGLPGKGPNRLWPSD